MTDERRTLLDELIYHLRGTCNDIDVEAYDLGLGELTIADYEYVECEIFQCTCGWWCELCEAHDVDGDLLCDDCFDSL